MTNHDVRGGGEPADDGHDRVSALERRLAVMAAQTTALLAEFEERLARVEAVQAGEPGGWRVHGA